MAINAADLVVNIDANVAGALHGIGTVNDRLTAFGVAAGTLVAHGVEALGRAVIGLGADAGRTAIDYETSMNLFQAVTGATGDEMRRVGELAQRLGADMTLPATSAGDAGEAMTELAKAGLSVEDAMNAARGTLQLAAAGAIDEARAAEIAANALNAFQLEGNKAGMVADLLAAAANRSSVEVTDVADSFKMASAVFSSFQGPAVGAEQSMVDLTTAIALLGNVGIKGSDAGTSLKQMLLQLTGPSQVSADAMKALYYAAQGATVGMDTLNDAITGTAKERGDALESITAANPGIQQMGDIAYDASGNMRPLWEIIELVRQGTAGMTEENRNAALTQIFGADATRAVIGLMRTSREEIEAMQGSLTAQGAAADLAGARTKGLGGAWDGFLSILETAQLAVAQPWLEPLEQGVRAAAQALADATPWLGQISQRLVEWTTSQAVPWLQSTTASVMGFLGAVQAAGGPMEFLRLKLFEARDALIQWVAEAIPQTQAQLIVYRDQLLGWAQEQGPALLQRAQGWGVALWQWVVDNVPALFMNLGLMRNQLIGWILEQVPGLIAAIMPWSFALFDWVLKSVPGLLANLGFLIGDLLDRIGAALPGIVEGLARWGAAFFEWVVAATPGMTREMLVLLGNLLGWIGDRAPAIAEKLVEWAAAFTWWVGTRAIPGILTALGGFLAEVIHWAVQSYPSVVAMFNTWIFAFRDWVPGAASSMLVALEDLSRRMLAWIEATSRSLLSDESMGRAIVDGFYNGLNAASSIGFQIINDWAARLIGVFKSAFGIASPSTVMFAIGGDLIAGLRDGLVNAWGTVTGLATEIGMSIRDKIGEWFGALKDVGMNLIGGVWEGIAQRWGQMLNDIGGIVAALPQFIKDMLGIASPSKVFADEIGRWIPEGIAMGALDAAPVAVEAVRDVGRQLIPEAPALAPVVPAGGAPAGAGGGGIVIQVTVQGNVSTENDLVDAIYQGLLDRKRRNVSLEL